VWLVQLDDAGLPRLNDAEAMPFAANATELRADLCRAPAVVQRILNAVPLPPTLAAAMAALHAACAPSSTTPVLTAGMLADRLVRAVPRQQLV
jgi:hypothetical protein